MDQKIVVCLITGAAAAASGAAAADLDCIEDASPRVGTRLLRESADPSPPAPRAADPGHGIAMAVVVGHPADEAPAR